MVGYFPSLHETPGFHPSLGKRKGVEGEKIQVYTAARTIVHSVKELHQLISLGDFFLLIKEQSRSSKGELGKVR